MDSLDKIIKTAFLSLVFSSTSFAYEPIDLELNDYDINYSHPSLNITTTETTVTHSSNDKDWFNLIGVSATTFMYSHDSFQPQNLSIQVMINSDGIYEALIVKSDKNNTSLEKHIKTLIHGLTEKNIYPKQYNQEKGITNLTFTIKLEKTKT